MVGAASLLAPPAFAPQNGDAASCSAYCDSCSGCTGFTLGNQFGQCWLKAVNTGANSANSDTTCYVFSGFATPRVYASTPLTDCGGTDKEACAGYNSVRRAAARGVQRAAGGPGLHTD